jgi:membrane protease YdiL (CAAX protease family)
MKKLLIGIAIALCFWFIMFSPLTAQKINFWAVMSIATVSLILYTFLANWKQTILLFRFEIKHIWIGILSAVLLYLFFFVGHSVASNLFGFAKEQVINVYSTKEGTSLVVISVLLLLLIGPAEEVFWRGFVQAQIYSKLVKPTPSILISTLLYTIVHIWALNLMLLIAAFFCGLFWGFIFYRYKSLVPVIISHSLWDFAIFILFPLS